MAMAELLKGGEPARRDLAGRQCLKGAESCLASCFVTEMYPAGDKQDTVRGKWKLSEGDFMKYLF